MSFENPEVLTGQFIADAVKGRSFEMYPPMVSHGILMHRWIDDFTDTHELVLGLRSEIRSELGLLSSPSLDIFFDHILARDWQQVFPGSDLDHFVAHTYEKLLENKAIMPLKMQMVLFYMSNHDWLGGYRHLHGIEKTFKGLSNRFSKGAGFLHAPGVLERKLSEVSEVFHAFFPELLALSRTKFNTFAPRN